LSCLFCCGARFCFSLHGHETACLLITVFDMLRMV
jgi:hypothetical protein